MANEVAVITGNSISGRIPHAEGFLDVTPEVLYFDSVEEGQAAADSIEVEHYVRGSHPVQRACVALDDPEQYPNLPDEIRNAHKEEHQALHAKMALALKKSGAV